MIRWVYAFVDRPRDRMAAAAAFWTAVTNTSLSAPRGEAGEFATFLPNDGEDACLKLQGVHESRGDHFDLAVERPRALADDAVALGAEVVAEHGSWLVLRSPAGQLFCVVPWHREYRRPPAVAGTRLDQIAIDIPAEAYEAEAEFWAELTGWTVERGSRPEFRVVQSPTDLPFRLLLHRLDEARPAGAHLDFACADRHATREAHEELGATFVADHGHWTVMRDPAGGTYCLTARNPATGRL
ncbi:VOC family protein [Streptacidiphilus neutrinimicus]|uniref:VOC family protein n=1 Tax=Streptacidiphilus neutrinimicus TaxID=105420 RepID=UPI0005A7A6F8|nr:VOC family protein [Streptacidiphilus neutrinimicus]